MYIDQWILLLTQGNREAHAAALDHPEGARAAQGPAHRRPRGEPLLCAFQEDAGRHPDAGEGAPDRRGQGRGAGRGRSRRSSASTSSSARSIYPRRATPSASTKSPAATSTTATASPYYTTLDNPDPARIHNIGLEEVKRIRAEMEKTLEGINFLGTLDQFLGFIRTDPRFFYKTPEELMAAYDEDRAKASSRSCPSSSAACRRPTSAFASIPAATAPTTTTAYYQPPSLDGSRPGNFYVNLYKPETRPMWEIEALTAHESVPGHHLQIALSVRAHGPAEFPPQRRIHRLRRRLGAVQREAGLRARAVQG